MDEWGETLSKLGAVGGTVYIFGKFVWPFLMQQVDKAQAREDFALKLLRDQGIQFTEKLTDLSNTYTESLRSRDVLSVEAHRDQMKAYNQITLELKTLSNYIVNGGGRILPPQISDKQNDRKK